MKKVDKNDQMTKILDDNGQVMKEIDGNGRVWINCRWLAEQIQSYNSYGIASKVYELINNGTIATGDYLPKTRELARQLGVVATLVSTAWGFLRDKQIITGNRRTGIWVLSPFNFVPTRTYPHVQGIFNLAWLEVDRALLPDLSQGLLYAYQQKEVNLYQRVAITPELEQQVRLQWPYPADSFLATDGDYDGLASLFRAIFLPGDAVAVTIPATTLLLDMLGHMKIGVVEVSYDNEGPIPSSLEAAIAHNNVVAFIYQPRTHSMTGVSTSSSRMEELAHVVRDSKTLLIEHDTLDLLSSQPRVSLGQYYPERTLHLVSYLTCYGPDLRLAVISGSRAMIEKIFSFRSFMDYWSSRILQGTLAWAMQDAKTQEQIELVREIYYQRRLSLIDALIKRDINTNSAQGKDGLSIWLKIPSEECVIASLIEQGIIVMSGSNCGETGEQHIRLTTSILLPKQIPLIADAIAEAFSKCN